MIPNMKFYVISIVSIFAALGIGIYIGFTIDTQSFIEEQKEDITFQLEEKFDFFKEENQDLKLLLEDIKLDNVRYEEFADLMFEDLVKDKLLNSKVAIIETKNDYMYTAIRQTLKAAGAEVICTATITDKIMDIEILDKIYRNLDNGTQSKNLIEDSVGELTKYIITGEENEISSKLSENNVVNLVGTINQPIDYIIMAGGSRNIDKERLAFIDKTIVNTAKDMNKAIIGVEQLKASDSYMEDYKSLKISTIDNVDTTIGKVALILAMEGRPGHYGIKKTAEELIPNPSLPIIKVTKEK